MSFELRERLDAVLKEQKAYRSELADDERWSVRGLSRQEASEVRAAWRREQERLRKAGKLLDTIDVLAIHGIELELRDRGWWNRRWPAVPDEAMYPGRWLGSRDGGFPKQVGLRLPQLLARKVYAACWHTSYKSIVALREWREQHPDIVPGRRRREPGDREIALEEYERLAAQVTTVGDVYRGGLVRGIRAAEALRPRVAN
ncbi:hypothetical protein HYE82_08555 [Streptomyces sp. BR123]|uniref:hypothetical protein n=1 Tax=Streptomyces sp. BR123 TaxID=2749828 RepID=UPI0015C44273|nr:hypothetical protein [Streptomyces sp. BR123]NXY94442.1 hypothetical protein [Streptomyces sp. BR123]